MVYEEDWLLPIFLKHYERYHKPSDIYIIDHGSNQSFSSKFRGKGLNWIYIPRDRLFSENSRMVMIESLCKGLMEYYDFGVYADCDELIALEFLEKKDLIGQSVIYTAGFDVFYEESTKKILGFFNPSECKPLIFKSDPDWDLGFHGSKYPPQKKLTVPLIHLKYFDRNNAKLRLNNRGNIYLNHMDLKEKNSKIDRHWENGLIELNTFYDFINSSTNKKIIPFCEIDSSPFFRTLPASNAVFIKNVRYDSIGDDIESIDEIFDLTPIFSQIL